MYFARQKEIYIYTYIEREREKDAKNCRVLNEGILGVCYAAYQICSCQSPKRSRKMKDSFVTCALYESDWLFNGRYSAAGGSDREIAFPADESRDMNNTLPISYDLTTIDEGKRVCPRSDTRKIRAPR